MLTQENAKLKQSLRIQSRNESLILHNSVSSLKKKRISTSSSAVVESHRNQEVDRQIKIIESLDHKLKQAEQNLIKERGQHRLQKRECRMIIEGLTQRVRQLKNDKKLMKTHQH